VTTVEDAGMVGVGFDPIGGGLVESASLVPVLSRDSSGEVPMFEPADGGWVVE
jgi:hypothetical protein